MPEITNPTEFDKLYFDSLPQELIDLYKNPDYFKALELAKAGFKVDGAIQVSKLSSPYIIMLCRLTAGYEWVPSFAQAPILAGPGIIFPGLPVYDPKNPPTGSIKVSLNSEDYTARPLPAIVVDDNKPLVGSLAAGNIYNEGPGDSKLIPEGFEWLDQRGKFVKHIVQGMMGETAFWRKI